MHRGIQNFYEHKYTTGAEILRTSKQFATDCVPTDRILEILDIGCGSGANSLALAKQGHHLHGVDISEAAIQQYRQHGFDGRVGDIEAGLDFADASFDLVFCSEVIEHLTFPEALASEIGRILKPEGQLVLSTPNSAFWLYRLLGLFGYTVSELQHPKHFQFFSRRSLVNLLETNQLRMKKIFGRNMYVILPDVPETMGRVLRALGFIRETRFRTGTHFWHLSSRSQVLNSLLADTLIVVMEKPR